MTEGIEPMQTTGELPRSARELLTGWANQQDNWVRAIVGEVVSTRREMSVDAIAAAKDRYLIEKQLADGEIAAVAAIGVSNGNGYPGEGLRLIAPAMSWHQCTGGRSGHLVPSAADGSLRRERCREDWLCTGAEANRECALRRADHP